MNHIYDQIAAERKRQRVMHRFKRHMDNGKYRGKKSKRFTYWFLRRMERLGYFPDWSLLDRQIEGGKDG